MTRRIDPDRRPADRRRPRPPAATSDLPPAVEYLCREYAKVVRAILERERQAAEQGSDDG